MIRSYLTNQFYTAPTQTWASRAGFSLDKIIPQDAVDFRTLRDLKLLYILSRRDPLCWRITKMIPALLVARGFKIIPQSPEAYKAIKKFLLGIHRADPVTAMLVGLRELAEDAVWSGNGWWERKYSEEWNYKDGPFGIEGNDFIGLKKIHPLTFDFKRNAYEEIEIDDEGDFGPAGDFLAYTQQYTVKKFQMKKDVDKRRICHLKFNSIGDEPWGVSDLEPIYKTRHRGANIEDGIAQGAFRHGVPFLDITVGDDAHPPDPEMLSKAAEEVKGSSYMSEYVHPPWFKTNMFEQFSLARSRGMLDPYLDLVSAATGLPKSLLMGTGEGTNKATVRELVNLLQPIVIAPRQQALKLFLESQIFAPLMEHNKIEGLPYVQWNELFPTDYSLADKLKVLSEITIEGKPLITWTEAREIAKLPAQEEGTFFTLSRQHLSAGKRGVNVPAPHGNLIHEGLKDALLTIKDEPAFHDSSLILLEGGKAYGEIVLKSPREIDMAGFKKYQSSHRVSDDEREKWFGSASRFYLWPIKIIKMYKPSGIRAAPGIPRPEDNQFLSNVNFYNQNLISIEHGGRLEPHGK